TILLICCVALLCVSLVACDPAGAGTDDVTKNPGEKPSPAKYTVEFKTNGDTVLPESLRKLYDVEYGSYIQPPKDENGKEIIPTKKGCSFLYWSANNKDRFDFDKTPITAITTLTAVYSNDTYKHNPVLTARAIYDSNGKFKEVNEDGRAEGVVYLEDAEANKDTTSIKSTYSEKSDMACAKTLDEDNAFCFWYYVDESGKPHQFTSWVSSSSERTTMLSNYSFDKGLTLYPMFKDNLPKVSVQYFDDPRYGEDVKLGDGGSHTFGDSISINDKFVPQKDGYTFDYWYYVVTMKDSDGKEYTTTEKFYYDEPITDDDKKTEPATSLMDAADAEDNFNNVTLKLYAKWTKEIYIYSPNDFKTLSNKLRVKNPTDEQKVEIEDILSANIYIFDIDFNNEEIEPLFDSEHVFKGVIDGGRYNEGTIDYRFTISRGIFGDSNHASVFGYSDGVIKNVAFNDVTLRIAQNDGKYNSNVYMGAITTRNGGSIINCDVVLKEVAIENLNNVVFGGITALNSATSPTTGIITECSVKIATFAADCEALTFGGVAGESNASSKISATKVDVNVSGVVCKNDGLPENGSMSYLRMGGIVGVNSGSILSSSVKINVENIESLDEVTFGGVVGENVVNGNIGKTDATVTLCSAASPAKVGGSLTQYASIGGLVGKNEGSAINSYSNAKLYVLFEKAASNGGILSIGGLMGRNYSYSTDSLTGTTVGIGAINYCYSVGEIVVKVAENLSDNVTVYAGGIAGRHSQNNEKTSKVGSIFANVSINVTNAGKNYLGKLFATMEKKASLNAKCFYAKESALVCNGTEFAGEEGEYPNNIEFQTVGTETESANFSNSEWAISTADKESTLGFSDEVWEIVDGQPSLVEPRA
ncbi:MAG: hypothetical protein K2G31_06545, partial [Clostridia bacterium]|nr:hypothetical protein [Clostridia bacterium]